MYDLKDVIPNLNPRETYDISLYDRISLLDFSQSKKNIVYLFPERDYGTFRYRAYNMCQVLNKTSDYASTFFFSEDILEAIKFIDKIDLVVLARMPWNYDLDRFIQAAKKRNIPLIYDVDDLIFDINKTAILANNLTTPQENLDFWFAYFSRRYYAAKFCDFFISTNGFLDERVKDVFPNKKTFIIPNYLNDEQMKVSEEVFSLKTKSKKYEDEKVFLMGYFSGTASHNHDFDMISGDIAEILTKYPNTKLRIVGMLDLGPKLSDFEESGRIERLPLVNYFELQVRIAECDLNLVPLFENEFTNCKSELKYFESAIVGVPSITSPTYVYKKCIKEKENGLIAKPGEWKESIEYLISDKKRAKEIGLKAREYALENYYGKRIEERVLEIIEAVLKK